MKKTYSRPDIIFEDFSLSASIAVSCEVKLDNPSKDVCGIKFDNVTVFVDGVTNCMPDNGGQTVGDGTAGNGLCYHVPKDTNNLFVS